MLNPLPLTSALAGRNRLLRGTQGDAALCPGLVSLALSAHNQCDNVKRKCSKAGWRDFLKCPHRLKPGRPEFLNSPKGAHESECSHAHTKGRKKATSGLAFPSFVSFVPSCESFEREFVTNYRGAGIRALRVFEHFLDGRLAVVDAAQAILAEDYRNKSRRRPDWRMIEASVPIGISRRPDGTIALRPVASRNF